MFFGFFPNIRKAGARSELAPSAWENFFNFPDSRN